MSEPTSTKKQKERNDTSIGLPKRIKERLQNLDFVKKHSDGKTIEILMDFYENHKSHFEKWQKTKNLTK